MKRFAILVMLAFLVCLPNASLATDVGGIINTDTTWDLAGSPYIITNKVQVAGGVTLRVEPGVEIIHPDTGTNYIYVWGTLNAIGTDSSRISFVKVPINCKEGGSIIIQYADFDGGWGFIQFSTNSGGSVILRDSVLDGTHVYLRAAESNCYLERNIFINAEMQISHPIATTRIYIRNNLFYNPQWPIFTGPGNGVMQIGKGSDQNVIEYNSFLNVDKVYAELFNYLGCDSDISIQNNYWNTTDTNVIEDMIYDRNDDLNIDYYVIYTPFLTEAHPDTPPFNIIADFSASPTLGAAPLTVYFTDQSTGSTSWQWDFGDDSESIEQNPSHIYTDPGTYTVSLTVTGLGGSDTETKTDFINVSQPLLYCQPSQGTIGTEITITGENFGVKKGKVTVGTSKCKVIRWTDTSISCVLTKVSSTTKTGTNDLTITPKGKGAEPIVMEDAFSIMAPRIQSIEPDSGEVKEEITITGSFFGTKKVKVYMDDGIVKKPKRCKLTSCTMDSETGESELKVLVPRGLNRGMCDLTVVNKVGSHTYAEAFTVD